MRDEDSCTRLEWTFYRSGQSVVGGVETAGSGIGVTVEAEIEVGKE